MATIDELKDEIRVLQNKNELYKKQLDELVQQSNEGLREWKKQELAEDIKFIRTIIIEKEKQITLKEERITLKEERIKRKEIEKEKQIATDKQIKIEKEKQIAFDKQYRLERGETTAAPITLDELKDEIRVLQNENELYKKQLDELVQQSNEELSEWKKQQLAEDINFMRAIIIEKEKQITADKQKEAAKKIEKEKQIAFDKQYRLERVGFQISLYQVFSQLFGLPLQHSQAGISTEADLTTSKRPTPIFPMDYTWSFISSRAMPSFRSDSSSTLPNSDSDYGMEMQTMETQPRQSLKNVDHSSLRHRIIKDRGLDGVAGGTG